MYMSYICSLCEVFVLVAQLLAAVTVSNVLDRPRVSQRRQREEQTYLPPSVGFPSGTAPCPTGLLCPRLREMTAVLLLYFGLVLVNTGDLPLLGPPSATH